MVARELSPETLWVAMRRPWGERQGGGGYPPWGVCQIEGRGEGV